MASITMAVTKVRCLIETDEVGADEPYVLVIGINLKNIPLPNVEPESVSRQQADCGKSLM